MYIFHLGDFRFLPLEKDSRHVSLLPRVCGSKL